MRTTPGCIDFFRVGFSGFAALNPHYESIFPEISLNLPLIDGLDFSEKIIIRYYSVRADLVQQIDKYCWSRHVAYTGKLALLWLTTD